MIIKKLYLDNFGKFKGYSLELGPELNVIHGENEAGKSTIMGFILMMFYGHGGKSADILKNPRRKFRPWNGEEMKGRVTFEHEGSNYLLERTFGSSNTTDVVTLWNEDLGKQVKLPAKASPGEDFFGIGENAFLRSVFISQGGSALNLDSKNDEITEKLLNLVTTGSEEVSYEKAKSLLQSREEQLVSKNGKNGSLVRTQEKLSLLLSSKREAIRQEDEKKEDTRRIEQKRLERAALEDEKASIEKLYNGYLIYEDIREHEDALKRNESRELLLRNLSEYEKKLTTPLGVIDRAFYSEGERLLHDYREFNSQMKHQEEEVNESKATLSELENSKVIEISDDVFNDIVEKDRQKAESTGTLSQKKEALRVYETKYAQLEMIVNLSHDCAEVEDNYQAASSKLQKDEEEFKSNFNEHVLITYEMRDLEKEKISLESNLQGELSNKTLREQAYVTLEQDLEAKIEDAKKQLEHAKRPQEYVVEVPGGRELRKPLLIFALLSIILFIVLGFYVDKTLFIGLAISVVLLGLSSKKVENQKLVRQSINENLIVENQERLDKALKESESRRAIEKEQLNLLNEKIERIEDALANKREEIRSVEARLTVAKEKKEKSNAALEESKLFFAKLESQKESATKNLLKAKENISEDDQTITLNDINEHRQGITLLEEKVRDLSKLISDTLISYNSSTMEEFSRKYYDFRHHLDLKDRRQKELNQSLEKLAEIGKDQLNTFHAIKSLLKEYREVESIIDAEQTLSEIRRMLEEKSKISLQLQTIEEHRTDLEIMMSTDALRQKLTEMKNQVHDFTIQNEVDFTDEVRISELKNRIEELSNKITAIREGIISSEAEVREKYKHLKNLSQIEDEINANQQKSVLQELDYESLKLAREHLVNAFEKMQSSFGPKVNKATQEIFARLTGGKYKEVMVSRDLSIAFQDTASQRMYEWAFLSGGTIEQAYLSLRLAITDLVVQDSKKKPLFLDDVFMQYDEKRAKEGLNFLSEYTRQNENSLQGILFTCHHRMVQWAKEIPEIKVISLFS